MHPVLRLYEDTIGGGVTEVALPARPRMIFVLHGALTIDGRALGDGEAFGGTGAVTLRPGQHGATCWRWELAADGTSGTAACGPGIRSQEKLSAVLDTI